MRAADTAARLGGDEFAVLLEDLVSEREAVRVAERIIAALSEPIELADREVTIGTSIGIAIAPYDGIEPDELIKSADLALYAAKGGGRGQYRFYSNDLKDSAHERREIEEDLRDALARGELRMHYQPVVRASDNIVTGFEALMRWNHPERGPISPGVFIPIAEETNLIAALGEWALRQACADAAQWPGNLRVAVNVSAQQFVSDGLPTIVTNALAASGLKPNQLELEITESVFMGDAHAVDEMFKRLKKIGVKLSLDDFGPGYSSLGYLRKAPFDKIKIDQSFVRGAAIEGSRNAAIIKAIVTLANTLGMETTAEGVELQDEIELIRDLGCSHIQGFVYGRPMLAVEAQKLLESEGGQASALGHKVSRAPRNKMLRSAILEIGGVQHSVRIRNISRTGAMIDGFESGEVGDEVLIELMDDQMFRAHLRWMQKGKAGLEFAEAFNLERLKSAQEPRQVLWKV
jgi:predicted signal transduction protein with EAL and GGDEF domain